MSLDEIVDRCYKDFGFYCKVLLSHTVLRNPSPKQLEIVHEMENNPHTEGVFNRQGGKSTIMAGKNSWKLCFGEPDDAIYLFAPIRDQTDIIAGKLRQIIRGNPILYSFVMPGHFSRYNIKMKSGAEFHALSASEQSHVRGHSPTTIQIDESQDISDTKYYEDILPSGSATGAKIEEIGTLRGRNHFFRNMLNKKIIKVYQNYRECPFIDTKYVERMRNTIPIQRFRQEFENVPDPDFGMALPYEALQLAFDLEPETQMPDPNGEYSAGIDFGKREDETVCFIFRKVKVEEIVHYYQVALGRWLGEDYDDVLQEMLDDYLEPYSPDNILGDKQGVGDGVIDFFPDSVAVEAQNLNNEDKDEMRDAFVVGLEKGRIHLWDDFQVRNQFEQWERTRTPSGKIRYHHPKGGSDDITIAGILAFVAGEEAEEEVDYGSSGGGSVGANFGRSVDTVLATRSYDSILNNR
jgi:hypothetical protein